MRILWIAPWARALARVYLDELVRTGHDVLLVTTERHFEKPESARPYERIITGIPRQPRSWPSVAAAYAAVSRFRPEVIFSDEIIDPRLLPMLRFAPLATALHDDAPHDDTEVQALRHRLVIDRSLRAAEVVVTFSQHVADAVRGRWAEPVVLPLPSEAGEELVPPIVPAARRKDFVLLGRIGPYKNLPGVFDAWRHHLRSPAYRGDRLIVIGDGDPAQVGRLPEACEWRRGRYRFADVLPVLAAAKGSLAYYASASQSGVQVISMQCATSVLVSDRGGLPEYLPPGEQPIPADAPARLAAALDELADPQVAEDRGRTARKHYDAVHHPAPATRSLLDVLGRLRDGGYRTRS